MNVYQSKRILSAKCCNAASFSASHINVQTIFLLLFLPLFIFSRPAMALELERAAPSFVVNQSGTNFLSLSTSLPEPAGEDSCLSFLTAARYSAVPSSAPQQNRRSAGKAAAIGFVFGVRFALAPKAVSRTQKKHRAVSFALWQPRVAGDMQAMAVAQYRRCKNDQALKALSDWRWAR